MLMFSKALLHSALVYSLNRTAFFFSFFVAMSIYILQRLLSKVTYKEYIC